MKRLVMELSFQRGWPARFAGPRARRRPPALGRLGAAAAPRADEGAVGAGRRDSGRRDSDGRN